MKSERLVVLLTPEEKARVSDMAARHRLSVGEVVRSALAAVDEADLENGAKPVPSGLREVAPARNWSEDPKARLNGEAVGPALSSEQTAVLERLADLAMENMTRANAALDQAFAELEATRLYFARKRGAADRPE